MKPQQYELEKYRGPGSRFVCPGCGDKGKSFVRYIDNATGQQVHSSVGRCNREVKCGYHYSPKQYFADNGIPPIPSKRILKPEVKHVPPSFIPVELMKASMQCYDENNFVCFLLKRFGRSVTKRILQKYFVGTSSYWQGASVFWQVDITGRIRTGKIMVYNPLSGRRVKEPGSLVNWVQHALDLPDFEMRQCLFGEHLLRNTSMPVGIVESEKTAIIASIYFPDVIWLATGGLSNLKLDKIRVLEGRQVTLFPDLQGYQKWRALMIQFIQAMPGTRFSISDLLEKKAGKEEKSHGYDIADYLLQYEPESLQVEDKGSANGEVCEDLWNKNLLGDEYFNTVNKITQEPLPDWYVIADKHYSDFRERKLLFHLFPSMMDPGEYIHELDF